MEAVKRPGVGMTRYRRIRPGTSEQMRPKATDDEKATVIAACNRFIADVLKPRFLPEIRPNRFNYVVGIYGRWHGSKYRFIQRYRSGYAENLGEEFESAFTRLDYAGPGRFDVMWMRHTGRWFRLYRSVPLKTALSCIEKDELLHPL